MIQRALGIIRDRLMGCPNATAEQPYGCTGALESQCSMCLMQKILENQ